jgi:hypothetical protein
VWYEISGNINGKNWDKWIKSLVYKEEATIITLSKHFLKTGQIGCDSPSQTILRKIELVNYKLTSVKYPSHEGWWKDAISKKMKDIRWKQAKEIRKWRYINNRNRYKRTNSI